MLSQNNESICQRVCNFISNQAFTKKYYSKLGLNKNYHTTQNGLIFSLKILKENLFLKN